MKIKLNLKVYVEYIHIIYVLYSKISMRFVLIIKTKSKIVEKLESG